MKTIKIDEEGFFLLQDGIRVSDDEAGHLWLDSLFLDENKIVHLKHKDEDIIVEAFDRPFVAKQIHLKDNSLEIQMPYHYYATVDLETLCVDAWDRFNGLTKQGIPFVLSRPAQAELFNSLEEYDDDSITIAGQKIATPDFYISSADIATETFWTDRYEETPSPGFNLEKPHPELKAALTQMKVQPCRILVPGCGFGHDAALLAEMGHFVTAVDLSPKAIEGAQKRYGHIKNVEFIEADVLNLDDSYNQAFDIVFEHTFYCALPPEKRDQIIKLWKRCLNETGHLLGIFFVVPKRTGPWFGGTEWELREKLQKSFQFLYWTRLQHSPGWRKGSELLIYSQIKK